MSADETAIMDYLKTTRGIFVSGREIARRADGKRRYEEDRTWAVHVLRNLVNKGAIESDSCGHFRIPPEEDKQQKRKRLRHLSPQMRRILENSGKTFEGVTIDANG